MGLRAWEGGAQLALAVACAAEGGGSRPDRIAYAARPVGGAVSRFGRITACLIAILAVLLGVASAAEARMAYVTAWDTSGDALYPIDLETRTVGEPIFMGKPPATRSTS